MSLDDLNREQKRMMRRQGALDERGNPARTQRQTAPRERVTPAQYLREVRDEMRKVAWAKRSEIVRYSLIVTVMVVLYTAYVFGIDFGVNRIADWFYA